MNFTFRLLWDIWMMTHLWKPLWHKHILALPPMWNQHIKIYAFQRQRSHSASSIMCWVPAAPSGFLLLCINALTCFCPVTFRIFWWIDLFSTTYPYIFHVLRRIETIRFDVLGVSHSQTLCVCYSHLGDQMVVPLMPLQVTNYMLFSHLYSRMVHGTHLTSAGEILEAK